MAKTLGDGREITEEMRKEYQAKMGEIYFEIGKRRVGQHSLGNGMVATYTYCAHVNGWYDWIDYWWGRQHMYVCVDCTRVIKLKKNQRVELVRK